MGLGGGREAEGEREIEKGAKKPGFTWAVDEGGPAPALKGSQDNAGFLPPPRESTCQETDTGRD